jgi:hypothetical protein
MKIQTKVKYMLLTLSLIAGITLVFGVNAGGGASSAPIPARSDNEKSSPTQASQQEQDELTADSRFGVMVVALRPTGFEPGELALTEGNYLFVFNNRTGLDDVALQLEREGHGANLLRERRQLQSKRARRQLVHLSPGSYLLKETNHPEWTMRIDVASK